MSETPYTDADLRTEAARQHFALSEDPDFMGVGERMGDSPVSSTVDGDSSLTWEQLLVPEGAGASYEAFGAAQTKIDDLITGAADLSGWAVDLGADGLEPAARVINIGWNDGPLTARIHLAFPSDMTRTERNQMVTDITNAVAATVPVRTAT